MTELTPTTIIPFLTGIFERRGAEEYLGEPVTIGEHMLQAAHFASRDGHDEIVVAAALLHDIGHFTGEFIGMPLASGTVFLEDETDRKHESAGAAVLEPFFPILSWIAANIMSRPSAICARVSPAISTCCQTRRFIRSACRAGQWMTPRLTPLPRIHILTLSSPCAAMTRPARKSVWMCRASQITCRCWNGWSLPEGRRRGIPYR